MTEEQSTLDQTELEARGRELLRSLRTISNAWEHRAENWHVLTARTLQTLVGAKDVKFVAGIPWVNINQLKRDGRVLLFTDRLLFDAAIRPLPNNESFPFTSVRILPRHLIRSIALDDDRPFGDGYPDGSVPPGMRLTVHYEGLEPIELPLLAPTEIATPNHLAALYRFVPSLLDDLGRSGSIPTLTTS